MPSAQQISQTRGLINAQSRVSAPAESPAELRQYVNSLIRTSHPEPWTVWTLLDYSLVTHKVTIVPYTCDYMVGFVVKFATLEFHSRIHSPLVSCDLLGMQHMMRQDSV